MILAATTGAQATVSVLTQGIAPLAPFLQNDYSLNRAQVGFLNLAIGAGSYASLILAGRLIDQLGERRMLLASGLIAGSFAALLLASRSFIGTLALIALTSVGVTVNTPAGSKVVMAWFSRRVRGTAMGVRQVGIPVGGVVASLTLPPLALALGWRGAEAVAGALAVLGGVLCFALYRHPPGLEPAKPGLPRVVSFGTILRNRNLWLISLYGVGMISAQFAFSLYIVLFAHERLGLDVVSSGALLALAQGVAIGARIGWGWLSDRVFGGDRRPAMAIIAAICGVSSFWLASLQPGVPFWLVVLPVLTMGISAIGWNGLYITSISELAGVQAAGTALGVSMTVSQSAVIVVPPLFGLLADAAGAYQPAWLALGIFVLVATAAIYRTPRWHE